jgi:PAS domain S-box-containing protein
MSVDTQTLHSETFHEISQLIERDAELVVEIWSEQVLEAQATANEVYREELRDRLPAFLRSLAHSLRHGNSGDLGTHRLSAVEHGEQRWTIGWKLPDLVRDYQILRIVLVNHLNATLDRALSVREVMAIGLLLDEAIAASVVMFVAHDERTISHAELRNREIMNAAADGIIVVDARGIVVMLNPAAERIFGSPAETLLGSPFQGLIGLSEAYAGATFWASPVEPPGVELPLRSQIRGRRGDGAEVDLEIAVSRFNRGNEPLSIALVRDVTEQKRLEEELKNNARQLEALNQSLASLTAAAGESNRAKSDFLAKMSHEIRSPMTAILGYVELLGLQLRAPDQLQAIDTIKRNANFLLDIINDVLDLSKIEARKFDIESAPVTPSAIVDELVALMHLRAAEKDVRLVMTCGNEVPATIESDPKRLKQILLNLVGNAIKFTDDGEVEISIATQIGRESREIAFAVRDTGIGMSNEDLAKAFEPFSQGMSPAAQRPGGTGLGLAISKHLAELLGGRIEAESGLATGSTFRLMLPLRDKVSVQEPEKNDANLQARSSQAGPTALPGRSADSQQAKVPDKMAETPLQGFGTPPAHGLQRPLVGRVLIADDRSDHRTVIAEFLGASGVSVAVADNGRSAVESVLQAEQDGIPFDVILMDMRMPELDGYQATARIRAAGLKTPIIALTASAMKGDHQRCIAIGCNDYLPKPIDFAVLIEQVARYAQREHPV